MNNTILLVDGEKPVLQSLKRALINEPYTVLCVQSAQEGLKVLENIKVKVIISDEQMPGMSGSEFLSMVCLRYPQTVRIMLTGQASVEGAMKALNEGEIYRFLLKPWSDMELKLVIRGAMEKYDLEMKNRHLLAMVRHQQRQLEKLENKHPGITHMEKNPEGRFVLQEFSEDDVSEILRECQMIDLP